MSSSTQSAILWNKSDTPPELHPILATLGRDYPIREGGRRGLPVRFVKTGKPGTCRVRRTADGSTVRYGTPALALRAVSALMAGQVPQGRDCVETSPFTTFGIMLDCSRNAVMTVAHFKQWLRQLALLGYNMAMLYTEDTYELPDEYYFGHLRGRYTAEELREIDGYAASLGIEMIPCIQTLGHLSQILQWPAYRQVRDTRSVLLVGEQKTYDLIAKMVAHWSRVFRSRRIHIGMDEAHDLGRGAYQDRNGPTPAFDLFNRHLAKVVRLCRKEGLKPMLWSDMYFRLGSRKMDYYDPDCRIPKKVVEKIPNDAELVYWDYYHEEPAFYRGMIERHRAIGFEPLVASGVWTWGKLWHDRRHTENRAGACIEASRKAGVRELFFTMWGDDGGYCDFDSALAGLAYCAEKAFAGTVSAPALAARFRAVCGADYAVQTLAADIEFGAGVHPCAAFLLWDDPLLQIYLASKRPLLKKLEAHYAGLADRLRPRPGDGGGNIAHARLLARALAAKLGLTRRLLGAYAARDRAALAAVRKEIPALIRLLEQVAESLRRQWMAQNKPFGFEVIQIRMGGVIARCRELDRRLEEYLGGAIGSIPELDAHLKPVPWRGHRDANSSYLSYASGSALF